MKRLTVVDYVNVHGDKWTPVLGEKRKTKKPDAEKKFKGFFVFGVSLIELQNAECAFVKKQQTKKTPHEFDPSAYAAKHMKRINTKSLSTQSGANDFAELARKQGYVFVEIRS